MLGGSLYVIASTMRYIVNRDPSFYWDRAYELSSILREQGLFDWLKTVALSLGSDHTYLPAAVPSLVFHLLSTDSLMVYGATIVAVYLAPIPVAAAFICVDGRDDREPADILVAGLAALAVMYPFAVRLLPTMPDFGGNLFITIALALGAGMIVRGDPHAVPRFRTLAPPVLTILALYLTAVVFRRWYGFAAVGLLGVYTTTLLLMAYAAKGRGQAWSLLKVLVGVGVLFAALSAPILAAKISSVAGGGIFAGAYDAYRSNYLLTFRMFGQDVLAAFGLLVATALLLHRPEARVFLFATLVANALAIALFLNVQAPGNHHFSLLWPILAVSVAVIQSRLTRGRYRTAGLLAATIASIAFIASNVPTKPRVDRFFSAYQAIAEKIRALDVADGALCPLGNRFVHHSIIDNLWQISGGSRGDMPRSTWILEVDFGQAEAYAADGLHDTLSRCEWIISTETLHLHHQPQYHRILRYHHQRLLEAGSIIGRAYELKDTLALTFPTPVTLYQRRKGSVIDADALEADYRAWLTQDKVALP